MTFQDFWTYSVDQIWPLVLLVLAFVGISSTVGYILWIKCFQRCKGDNEYRLPLLSHDANQQPNRSLRVVFSSIQRGQGSTRGEEDAQLGWYDYLNQQHQEELRKQRLEAEESRISAETYLRNTFAQYDEFKSLPIIGRRPEKTWFLVRGNFGDKMRHHVISAISVKRDQWPYLWGKKSSSELKKLLLNMRHDCLLAVEGMEFNLTRHRIILRFNFHEKGSINDYQRQVSPLTAWKEKQGSSLRRFSVRQSVEIIAQVISGLYFLYHYGIQPVLYLHRSNLIIKSITSKDGGRVQHFRILLSAYDSRLLCRDDVNWDKHLSVMSHSDSSYECTQFFLTKYLASDTPFPTLQITYDIIRLAILLLELSCGEIMRKEIFSSEKVNRLLSSRIRDKSEPITVFIQTIHTLLCPMFSTPQSSIPSSLDEMCKLQLFLPYLADITIGIPSEVNSSLVGAEVFSAYQFENPTVTQRGTSTLKTKKTSDSDRAIRRQSVPVSSSQFSRQDSSSIPVNKKTRNPATQKKRHTSFRTMGRSLETNDTDSPTSPLPHSLPPPPPPPPPPGSSLPNTPSESHPDERNALLFDIRRGAQLRHVASVKDRSAPRI